MAHVLEVQLSSKTVVKIRLGIAFTKRLLIPWNSRTRETLGRCRLMRCLRTKKQVASTADMASREIKEIAMIDHAEFSKLGIIHNSMSGEPAYVWSTMPEALETKTACIFIPAEFPAIATKTPPSSLSYTIAAANPAFWAFLTLSSKPHPPLTINTNGELAPSTFFTALVKGEHASRGSATYNIPHSPDPLTGLAKLAWMSSKERVTLFPMRTTLAKATEAIRFRKAQKGRTRFIDLIVSEYQKRNIGNRF